MGLLQKCFMYIHIADVSIQPGFGGPWVGGVGGVGGCGPLVGGFGGLGPVPPAFELIQLATLLILAKTVNVLPALQFWSPQLTAPRSTHRPPS